MMIRTLPKPAPIVTMLSSSALSSIKAASKLTTLCNTMKLLVSNPAGKSNSSPILSVVNNDALDQTLQQQSKSSPITTVWRRLQRQQPQGAPVWNSLGVMCQETGTILHFLSQGESAASASDAVHHHHTTTDGPRESQNDQSSKQQQQQPLQLLSITDYQRSDTKNDVDDSDCIEGIAAARTRIADQIVTNRQSDRAPHRIFQQMKSTVTGRLEAADILDTSGSTGGLPILSLPKESDNTDYSSSSEKMVPEGRSFLKEIVIPSFDYATYDDGSTIVTQLGSSPCMKRVVASVYQWPDCYTVFRPLPSSAEDRRLPPPSLVIFQPDVPSAVSNITSQNHDHQFQTARIGYGGLGDGQIMLQHPDLAGLDVRFCPRTEVTSAFAEAQEALLAASIDELQNANTLLAGGEKAKDDERVGHGDCWVEVRANLKQPSGYFRSIKENVTRTKPKKLKVAKIPDLPYE